MSRRLSRRLWRQRNVSMLGVTEIGDCWGEDRSLQRQRVWVFSLGVTKLM